MGNTKKIPYSELLDIINNDTDLKNKFILCKNLEERKSVLLNSLNLDRPIANDAIKRVHRALNPTTYNEPPTKSLDKENNDTTCLSNKENENSNNKNAKQLNLFLKNNKSTIQDNTDANPLDKNSNNQTTDKSNLSLDKKKNKLPTENNKNTNPLINKEDENSNNEDINSQTITSNELSEDFKLFTTTENIAKELINLKEEISASNKRFVEMLNQKNDIQEAYNKLYNDFQKINSKEHNTNNSNNINIELKKISTLIDMNSERITIEIPKGFVDTAVKYVDANDLSSFEYLMSKKKDIYSHIAETIFLIFIYQNSLLD